MNLPVWSYPLSPFYPSTTPTNCYGYPYIQPPYNTNIMLNSSIQTSLNSSSGYESAGNETSLVDPCFSSPICTVKKPYFDVIHQDSNDVPYEDNQIDMNDDTDDNASIMTNQDSNYGRKKRRKLSQPQRQEANRRERHRMEIINRAYEDLRNVLPFKNGRKRQKMSRMDTVDGAIRYIHSLLETLHGPNYNPDW